ncbi:hypothetical protein SAR03_04860 [Staphylococcus arlettae]|uniref:Uncharacterized protein n=1 Tax=Staphylococcus arlettae TaxID=29378 RepID=A0ABQ0XRL7_9STAP|nr:hypothetical protein SAR03_04860 [Staphylococcus arlettae]
MFGGVFYIHSLYISPLVDKKFKFSTSILSEIKIKKTVIRASLTVK